MSSSSKNNKVTKVKITTSKVKSKAKSRTKSKTKAKAKSKAAKKTSIKPSLKNKLKNKILYVLDASGSMNGLRYDVMRAFNSNLQTAKTKSKESNQQTSATLTTFGEAPFSHPIVKLKDIDVNLVTELNAANYAPYGNTPLLDAVGQTINLFKNDKDPNTSFVMFVVTDGQENCSENYTRTSLAKLIKEVSKTDRWTFVFLVPPGEADSISQNLDIPRGNIMEWETTSLGIEKFTSQVNSGINNYYVSRASGQTAVRSFFTDMSKVSAKEVKKKLDDIKNDVMVWTVNKEEEIRDFVENHKFKYVKGNAFYQLTKPETIQSNKKIILVEKNKLSVYAGEDARELLKLPNSTTKVIPGNHSNWDIFVQSTSTNRKLVRGTKLVYIK